MHKRSENPEENLNEQVTWQIGIRGHWYWTGLV